MASRGGLSGLALAEIAGGVILAWSGVSNQTLTVTIRALVAGKKPPPGPASSPAAASPVPGGQAAAAGDTTAHGASAAANQTIARLLAAPYGWAAGQNWADLVSLWNRESGWSNTIANTSSGALGIAQALGHGTTTSAGSLGNEYPSRAANDGNAAAQIAWGLAYIHDRYGSPTAAWAHEESAGWY